MVLLGISNGKLHCRDQANTSRWELAIKDLVLIAEHTTRARPNCDDYFLVFVTREKGELFYLEVTGCAAGIPEALEQLETFLNSTIENTLQSSTDFASRVIWPKALAGAPFYQFEEAVPASLADRIRCALKGKPMTHRVAEPVMRYLSESAPPIAELAS